MAAALAVTKPCGTGLSGIAFCLFYEGLMSFTSNFDPGLSGRTRLLSRSSSFGVCSVPGAPALWCHTVQLFGSQKEVLSGVAALAEEGFPVAEVTAHHWKKWADLLIGGRPPKHGEVFKNTAMAQTIKELGQRGKPRFYQGRVDVINQSGGVMTLEDLSSHDSEVVSPISTDYKSVGASSQRSGPGRSAAPQHPGQPSSAQSSDYVLVFVEAVRLAQTDASRYLGDAAHVTVPTESLLAKSYSSSGRGTSAWTGHQRAQFGRGHMITVGDWWSYAVPQTSSPPRVLWAGSDPRAGGCAQGY